MNGSATEKARRYGMKQLEMYCYDLRQQVLDMIVAGRAGHIGGDMSVMEILVAIYDRMRIAPETAESPERDRFVLSKGHCVEALYAVLAAHGFLDIQEVIASYSKFGSKYIGHPNNRIPGIEMNSGSLGHGLCVCVGMALAGKMDGLGYRVYTVMGDGELAEGSVWEAAMAASQYQLDHLCAVVDRNHLQISGSTEEVMAQNALDARFESFGWHVINVENGNSISQLQSALDEAEQTQGRPTLLIANTVKGFGSPLMENQAAWHHKVPTQEEYIQISRDFSARKEALSRE